MTLARSVSGLANFDYTEIGNKPGEKLFEELVTESEAPRTVIDGDLYIVLSDILKCFGQIEENIRLMVPWRSCQGHYA